MVDYSKYRDAQYRPIESPKEYSNVWISNELDRISRVLEVVGAGHLEPIYVAPEKPRAGDIRYADGTSWNPGSGEGIYRFSLGAAWVKLG